MCSILVLFWWETFDAEEIESGKKTCKKCTFFMKNCYNFYIFFKYIAEKIIIGEILLKCLII